MHIGSASSHFTAFNSVFVVLDDASTNALVDALSHNGLSLPGYIKAYGRKFFSHFLCLSSITKFYKISIFLLEDSKKYYEVQIHKFFLCFMVTTSQSNEETVLSAFDEILWLLKDGEWHDLRKIIEKCSSPKFKLKMAVSFLWEYDFIQVNEKGKKARVRPRIRKFIDEIQRVEKEELQVIRALRER